MTYHLSSEYAYNIWHVQPRLLELLKEMKEKGEADVQWKLRTFSKEVSIMII